MPTNDDSDPADSGTLESLDPDVTQDLTPSLPSRLVRRLHRSSCPTPGCLGALAMPPCPVSIALTRAAGEATRLKASVQALSVANAGLMRDLQDESDKAYHALRTITKLPHDTGCPGFYFTDKRQCVCGKDRVLQRYQKK